tara:strand:- start:1776 stop:2174 length:399 start_codon:yes stop_codon:yes gene_type:complete
VTVLARKIVNVTTKTTKATAIRTQHVFQKSESRVKTPEKKEFALSFNQQTIAPLAPKSASQKSSSRANGVIVNRLNKKPKTPSSGALMDKTTTAMEKSTRATKNAKSFAVQQILRPLAMKIKKEIHPPPTRP